MLRILCLQQEGGKVSSPPRHSRTLEEEGPQEGGDVRHAPVGLWPSGEGQLGQTHQQLGEWNRECSSGQSKDIHPLGRAEDHHAGHPDQVDVGLLQGAVVDGHDGSSGTPYDGQPYEYVRIQPDELAGCHCSSGVQASI